jgi:hypothetical protein
MQVNVEILTGQIKKTRAGLSAETILKIVMRANVNFGKRRA